MKCTFLAIIALKTLLCDSLTLILSSSIYNNSLVGETVTLGGGTVMMSSFPNNGDGTYLKTISLAMQHSLCYYNELM